MRTWYIFHLLEKPIVRTILLLSPIIFFIHSITAIILLMCLGILYGLTFEVMSAWTYEGYHAETYMERRYAMRRAQENAWTLCLLGLVSILFGVTIHLVTQHPWLGIALILAGFSQTLVGYKIIYDLYDEIS